jgi:hypothetical protein
MKQKKLLKQLYQACVAHDAGRLAELRKQEFAKILKRKAEGRTFTGHWHVVSV